MSRHKLYGLHAARSALKHAPERIIRAWIDDQRRDLKLAELRQHLLQSAVPVAVAKRERLDALAGDKHHQGIVLEVLLPAALDEKDLDRLLEANSEPLLLVLDQIQDPHNLGACLRTAAAVGVTGVILPKDRTVGLTPAVCKVASGAAETVPLLRVTNLARVLRQLRAADVWIAGADGSAPTAVFEADLSGPLALVIGAEGKGLRRLTREACDFLVKLPMKGSVESLNLSVAAAVLMYEALRQRQFSKN